MEELACLMENELENQMNTIVLPVLKKNRECGFLSVEGGNIFYELLKQKQPSDTVVICHGFTESGRKFDEFAYYLFQAGYQVVTYDQRGHGQSMREGKHPNVVHIKHFQDYVDDLHQLISKVVKPNAGEGKIVIYGHSMGGCVAALFIEQNSGMVDGAILSSPMLGINLGACPTFIAKCICHIQRLFGRGEEKLFYQGDFEPEEPFSVSCANSEMRHLYYQAIRREHPEYQSNAASYSWALEAVNAGKKVMKPANIAKVTIPVLIFMAEKDNQVKNRNLIRFSELAPKGELVLMKDAKHEIYRAENDMLIKYLERIIEFLRSIND